jgi:hypothetical protein
LFIIRCHAASLERATITYRALASGADTAKAQQPTCMVADANRELCQFFSRFRRDVEAHLMKIMRELNGKRIRSNSRS